MKAVRPSTCSAHQEKAQPKLGYEVMPEFTHLQLTQFY
jgi:hypothetical protein